MEALNKLDVDLLIETVEKWEQTDSGGIMIRGILGAILSKSEEEKKERDQKFDQEMEEEKKETKNRKERAIMLKAKLLTLRNSMLR